jgi:ribonuclease HII
LSAPRSRRASRLQELLTFDQTLLETARDTHHVPLTGVLGVDEVGRGSLIGPVIAAALVFPARLEADQIEALATLDDSKAAHFNHAKRIVMAETLKSFCYWGIGEATQHEVETLNVSQASLLASHRAIDALQKQFSQCPLETHLVVIDGRMKIPGLKYLQTAEIKADSRSAAVAGASIIAKAYRDSLVIELAQTYPGYNWETNAGYPTPGHQAALEALGVTPLHRRTYKVVQAALEKQQTLLPLA